MNTLRDILMAAVEALDLLEPEDHIKVWRYKDAPPVLQDLSQNGGDEDWLAVVPDEVIPLCYIPWLDAPFFGAAKVNKYPIAGAIVYIGCHT